MKKVLLLGLFLFVTFFVKSQDVLYKQEEQNYYYKSEEFLKFIFLESMDKPINSSDPNLHPLLDSDWYYDQNNSDEFNGSQLNTSKWITNYGWGNGYTAHIAHNRQDKANHIFDGSNLKLRNVKEDFSQNMSYNAYDFIERDGKPNYRSLPYTSAMIRSKNLPKNLLDQPYGFVEIRCKVPRCQYVMANFWLWDAADEWYNEIDIFEIANGNTMYQTTHVAPGGEYYTNSDGEKKVKCYHHEQHIQPLDGDFFSNQMNTYAVKWEPNKIIYYFNNKVTRIITEHIPQHKMNIIVDMAFRTNISYLSDMNLDESNSYIIDYIRVFHRNDYRKPDPIFYINGKNGKNLTNPILIDESSSITLNAEESYSIDNAYFIGVQEVNSSNIGIGNGVSKWFLNTQLKDISSFDLKDFCLKNGLTLKANSTYRIKLVAGGGEWIENIQYIKVQPHQNSIQFLINGSNNLTISIKNVPSYQDVPKIILDGSQSVLSGNDFYIGIEPSSATWQGTGVGVGSWFLDVPEKLKNFDLRDYAKSKGLVLEYGKYYKVTLATANPWTSSPKLFYIQPCTNYIDFRIKNGVGENPIVVSCLYNQPEIYLTTWLCNSCYSDDYFVGVENSNANGDRLGGGVGDWLIPTSEFSDVGAFINLRNFTSSRGLELKNGKYYLVKVATGNPWTEKTKLLYIDECISNPDFTIEGQNGTVNNPVEIQCAKDPNVRLSAWNGIACDNYYYLSLWKCDKLGNCIEIANQWLPTELVDNMKNTDLTSLAYYNLYDHFKKAPFYTTLCGSDYYKISLCTGFDGWKCKDVYIHMNQTKCLNSLRDLDVLKKQQFVIDDDIDVYPNPTFSDIYIKFNVQNVGRKSILITDILGRVIYNNNTDDDELIVSLQNEYKGVLFVKIDMDGSSIVKKVIRY